MKVLFITRKYPPQVGGMEKYSYELIKYFPRDKKVIALNRSQIHLIWFLPYALMKGIFLSKGVDLIYLCDGLLAPLGLIVKKIVKKPVLATVHGLDITYNNWLYKKINIGALKKLDKIISVSNSTVKECIVRGVKKKKCTFIPNGIEIKENNSDYTKKDLSKYLGLNVSSKKVLITVGRLVKRKGVAWFIENVLNKLDSDIIYLIVGQGKEKENIQKIINDRKLSKQVFLLGRISNNDLDLVYSTSDLFIMPNIKIKGDTEGFGIVALEASLYGLPVIASRLEGIRDAIIDNKNGILVNSCDANEFKEKISELLADSQCRKELGMRFSKYTKENYNWEKISHLYLDEFKKLQIQK